MTTRQTPAEAHSSEKIDAYVPLDSSFTFFSWRIGDLNVSVLPKAITEVPITITYSVRISDWFLSQLIRLPARA